jgi:hypothetical protein
LLQQTHHITFKDVVVSKKLLSQIQNELVNVSSYKIARKLIERKGLPNADEVLTYLGYRVIWKGLDPESATIKKL